MTYCPLTGKQMFATRRDALRAAKNTTQRGKGSPSVYWCEWCNAYHLTHFTYSHSRNVRQMRSKIPEYQPPKTTKKKKMKIIIDNAYVPNGTTVQVHNLDDGGQQLRLILFDEENRSLDARYTYEQALELVEAIKIQLTKMKI